MKHIPALDGLRGVAILLVFWHHYGGGAQSKNPVIHAIGALCKGGWMGVDLFFVLSGFLITGILLATREQSSYFQNFYARRALRLFPLFYGLAFLLLLLTPILDAHWRFGHLAYLFYAANIAGVFDPSLNSPSPYLKLSHLWSLAIEEQFYLVWPTIIFLNRSRKRLGQICLGVIVGAPLIRTILSLSNAADTSFLYNQTFCRMDSLALGALIAIIYPRGTETRIPALLPPSLMAIGGAALFAVIFHEKQLSYHTVWMETFGFTAVGLFCTGLLCGVLSPGSIWSTTIDVKVLRFAGKYSYGIYVYHVLVEPDCKAILQRLELLTASRSIAALIYFPLSLTLILAIAVVSYEFFEKPVMHYKSLFSTVVPQQVRSVRTQMALHKVTGDDLPQRVHVDLCARSESGGTERST